MKFKGIIIIYLLLTGSFVGSAQEYKKNIEKRFDEFYNLTASGEIDRSMDYIPDVFFTIFPKDQMVSALKSVMNSNEVKYKILDYKITDIKDEKKIDNNYYALLGYTSNIIIKFSSTDTLKSVEKKQSVLGRIKLSLANTFGTDNVKLDEQTGFFTINAHKKSCAISSNGSTDWKFVNIEARQRIILDKILPKEIIESL